MTRRDVLAAGLASGAAAISGPISSALKENSHLNLKPFTLNYAPHFGMFQNHAGGDPVDQLKFAADEGFAAWEDNGMKGRSVDEQNRIAKAMTSLGIKMGIFVAKTSNGVRQHWPLARKNTSITL